MLTSIKIYIDKILWFSQCETKLTDYCDECNKYHKTYKHKNLTYYLCKSCINRGFELKRQLLLDMRLKCF